MTFEAAQEAVRGAVATIFNLPLEEVSPESSSETVENWDSMGHLMLILELEQQFECTFSPEDVERMHDVSSIARIVSEQSGL